MIFMFGPHIPHASTIVASCNLNPTLAYLPHSRMFLLNLVPDTQTLAPLVPLCVSTTCRDSSIINSLTPQPQQQSPIHESWEIIALTSVLGHRYLLIWLQRQPNVAVGTSPPKFSSACNTWISGNDLLVVVFDEDSRLTFRTTRSRI